MPQTTKFNGYKRFNQHRQRYKDTHYSKIPTGSRLPVRFQTPIVIDPPTQFKQFINCPPDKVDKTTKFRRLPVAIQNQYRLQPDWTNLPDSEVPYTPAVPALHHTIAFDWTTLNDGNLQLPDFHKPYSYPIFTKAIKYHPRPSHNIGVPSRDPYILQPPPAYIKKYKATSQYYTPPEVEWSRFKPPPPKIRKSTPIPPDPHNPPPPAWSRIKHTKQGRKYYKNNKTGILHNFNIKAKPIDSSGPPVSDLDNIYNTLLLELEIFQDTFGHLVAEVKKHLE